MQTFKDALDAFKADKNDNVSLANTLLDAGNQAIETGLLTEKEVVNEIANAVVYTLNS